jgi:hypothetical protein
LTVELTDTPNLLGQAASATQYPTDDPSLLGGSISPK